MNQELKDVQEEFRRKLAEDNRDGLDMVRLQLKKEKKFLSDKPCRNIADTLDVLGQTIAPWDKEISMAVMMDEEHRVICVQVLSTGTESSAYFMARDFFAGALLSDAKLIIHVHNHPSGDCTPSRNDRLMHDQLVNTSKYLGFGYFDSIDLGSQTYYSFRQKRINPYRRDKNGLEYVGNSLPEKCPYPQKRSLIHS